MIDVHCHLNFHAFEKDVSSVIEHAFTCGVTTIINVGTQLHSSSRATELARQYENMYAIVGIHPHHADKITLTHGWLKELEQLAKQPKVVAIGEIGMDFYHYASNGIVNPKQQEQVFKDQLLLAHSLHLPIQIHNRHAGREIISILEKFRDKLPNPPGMFHCFAGDMFVLKSALEMGFYIGYDGNSTYPGFAPGETVHLSQLIQETPLERIVTETDSPFLTPEPYRGSRNEPAHVIIVGEYIARVKKISFSEMDKITTRNAKQVFSL